MKQMIKYAAVGLCCYLLGFYEMKCKALSAAIVATNETMAKKEDTPEKE